MNNTEMAARIKTIVRLLDETQAVLRGVIGDLVMSSAEDLLDETEAVLRGVIGDEVSDA